LSFIIGTFFAYKFYLIFRKRFWAEHPKNIKGGEMGPPDFGKIQNQHCRFEDPAKLVLFIRCGVVLEEGDSVFFCAKNICCGWKNTHYNLHEKYGCT